MKKYKVYSKQEGYFLFGYDDNGELCYFERVDRKVVSWEKFIELLPTHDSMIAKLVQQGFVVEPIIEVTFDNFWNLYDDKRDKTKTKAIWDRLSESKRKQYFEWVKPYFKFLQEKYQNTDWTNFKKMPKSYLSKENAPWEDEAIRKYYKK